MNNSISTWFQNLQNSDLQPIVRQVLNWPNAEVLNWQIQPLSGGATEHVDLGFGVYRVIGTARDGNEETPWSAVVKIVGPSANASYNDHRNVLYWKREVLAIQSGILDQLPAGNLVTPRCYAIQELPGEKYCIWLEAIDEIDRNWTMELDEALFAGYSAGLRDAGWQGDSNLARFGYTVMAGLFGGMIWSAVQSYQKCARGLPTFGGR